MQSRSILNGALVTRPDPCDLGTHGQTHRSYFTPDVNVLDRLVMDCPDEFLLLVPVLAGPSLESFPQTSPQSGEGEKETPAHK